MSSNEDDGESQERKMKKKMKKPQVELVQYQKPELYELVTSDDDGGHGHGGQLFSHAHGHGHGHGLHKKKYGRSIGGLFGRLVASAILFGFGSLLKR